MTLLHKKQSFVISLSLSLSLSVCECVSVCVCVSRDKSDVSRERFFLYDVQLCGVMCRPHHTELFIIIIIIIIII